MTYKSPCEARQRQAIEAHYNQVYILNKSCREYYSYAHFMFLLYFSRITYIRTKPHRWCNSGVLTSSVVDRQTKDCTIGICCFSAKHKSLRRKGNNWLARNQNNVSEWSDMSNRRMRREDNIIV